MTKIISALDFCSVATCETGEGRLNLETPWRQDTRLAASDGRRLHYVTGLAATDVVHYIDGRDCQPPPIDQVIGELPDVRLTLHVNPSLVRKLKVLCNLREAPKQKKYTASSALVAILSAQKGRVTLRSSNTAPVRWSLDLDSQGLRSGFSDGIICALNLGYLVDTMIPNTPCEIRCSKLGDPIYITYDRAIYRDYHALIMPIRLDGEDLEA